MSCDFFKRGTLIAQRLANVEEGGDYYFLYRIGVAPLWFWAALAESQVEKFIKKADTLVEVSEDINNPFNKDAALAFGPKSGTAFSIGENGYVLTNYHVIADAKVLKVKGLYGDFSTEYAADVVAADIPNDLALLKIKNPNISFDSIPYEFNNEIVDQGTKTFVLGYPLTQAMGEEIKLTDGLISAKSGYKGSVSQYQFSAPVQPGNSGSPLFDEEGNLIGIISAKLSNAEGAGYAVKSPYLNIFLASAGIETKSYPERLKGLTLAEKAAILKNYIFIVKAE